MSRRRKPKNKYRLSKRQYEILYQKQNGLCAICKLYIPEIHEHSPVPLTVDHDHITHKVRGLLCCICNTALGEFRDDPNILQSAIDYLNENTNSL
jgi:hypothetical protein